MRYQDVQNKNHNSYTHVGILDGANAKMHNVASHRNYKEIDPTYEEDEEYDSDGGEDGYETDSAPAQKKGVGRAPEERHGRSSEKESLGNKRQDNAAAAYQDDGLSGVSDSRKKSTPGEKLRQIDRVGNGREAKFDKARGVDAVRGGDRGTEAGAKAQTPDRKSQSRDSFLSKADLDRVPARKVASDDDADDDDMEGERRAESAFAKWKQLRVGTEKATKVAQSNTRAEGDRPVKPTSNPGKADDKRSAKAAQKTTQPPSTTTTTTTTTTRAAAAASEPKASLSKSGFEKISSKGVELAAETVDEGVVLLQRGTGSLDPKLLEELEESWKEGLIGFDPNVAEESVRSYRAFPVWCVCFVFPCFCWCLGFGRELLMIAWLYIYTYIYIYKPKKCYNSCTQTYARYTRQYAKAVMTVTTLSPSQPQKEAIP
jgi:hypothetical protein